MPESEYLDFGREVPTKWKTPLVKVRSRRGGDLLGTIKWYGPWRQFCFYPEPGTIFNVGCMTDIEAQIAELKAERAEAKEVEVGNR